jgi:hypothetical protein
MLKVSTRSPSVRDSWKIDPAASDGPTVTLSGHSITAGQRQFIVDGKPVAELPTEVGTIEMVETNGTVALKADGAIIHTIK